MNALALLLLTTCPVGAGPVIRAQYVVEDSVPSSAWSSPTYASPACGCCPTPCGGDCCGTTCGEVITCCPEPCCQSRPGLFTRIRNKIRSWRHGNSCDCCCSDCCTSCGCASCSPCGSCCTNGCGCTSYYGGQMTPGEAIQVPAAGGPALVPSMPPASGGDSAIQPMPAGEPGPEAIPTAPQPVK